ncbi:hypothetical protein PG994_009212 [Apiospora phragmitis]|uniref:SMODS and SLOG-associating 2TM effector domain-containing protein n=1 Tax=Apiospora phragmitis TaxID=2905665 RepID=A0ABR1UIP4_9PEZI
MALFTDPQQLEVQTQHIVTAATNWAAEMHSTLAGIQGNTNQLFFWFMFVGLGVAAAVTLWTLNRLRDELQELNHHQVVYRQMWLDERDQMHRQMEYDEDRNDHINYSMQQQWSTVEKNKHAIMERGLQQQSDLVKALLEEPTATGPAKPAQIPKRGEPGFDSFRDALTNYAEFRYTSQGRADQGQ